jgi:anti-anti-sigma factor
VTPLTVTVSDGPGDRVTLEVTGDLDLSTGPVLEEAILPYRAAGRHVVLDLSGVPHIDSLGIAVLIRSANDAAEGGWSFSLVSRMPPAVARVLELSGVLPRLSILEDA